MPRPAAAVLGAVFLYLIAVSAIGRAALVPAAQQAAAVTPAAGADPPETHAPLVTRYCAGCHNERLRSGNLDLGGLNLQQVGQSAEVAERVIRKVRAGMMPPAGAPRPGAADLAAFVASLESAIDAAAGTPRPGARPFQRLNRAEYARSIRDLLGLEVDVHALLPPDTMSAGFDNIADAQAFSPAVMDGYMRAAARIAADALGDPAAGPTSATYSVSSTTSQMRHVDGAPFGTRGGVSVVHSFPADGEYVFTVRLQAATNGGLIGQRSAGEQIEISVDGEAKALLDIPRSLTEGSPEGLNVRSDPVFVRGGAQRLSAAFMPKFSGLVDDIVAPIEFTLADAIGAPQLLQLPHLQDLYVTGPHTVSGVSDTPSRRAVFTCRPRSAADEAACATEILTRLATQAYRRPVVQDDLAGLIDFYEAGRREDDFEAGIRTALQAILASPHFVFRLERQPGDAAPGSFYPIGDIELASRLSYFLWSAPPDADLLDAARRGALQSRDERERQVRRLLEDPRAEALATRFATQWLRLWQIDGMTPDGLLYPMYDQTLARVLRRETELLFESIVREDRSVFDLLTADYTFVNERSALHYGIPGVVGSRLRRVAVTDPARQGVLGHAGILTMTSNADRTSPVQRGKWVMEVLLGIPPPPPPPNVPELEASASGDDGRLLPVRERLAAHRANPACSSCHQMIDPIGLALEHFDPTGVWRINDSGSRVDATTELYDGTPLDGPVALRQALLRYADAVAGNFTENLLTYALGRRIEHTDMPAVRAIARHAASEEHRFSAFVMGIVESAPFRMAEAE